MFYVLVIVTCVFFIDMAEKTVQCCKESGVPTRCRGFCLQGKPKEQPRGLRKLTPGKGCKQHFKTIVHCVHTVGLQEGVDYSFVSK